MPIVYCQLLPLASMALVLHQLIIINTLVFALVLARVDLSTCNVLKGSLTCLDCTGHYDFSDIRVLVKCSQAKKSIMVTTKEDGTFQADLPSTTPTPPSSFNCLTKILGGPKQLYASRKDMESTTVKVPESDSYTTSSPLKFYTSCPNSSGKDEKCGAHNKGIGSSKTFDIPLPPEWGLAPSSYYFPYFFPIIGIP